MDEVEWFKLKSRILSILDDELIVVDNPEQYTVWIEGTEDALNLIMQAIADTIYNK